MGFLAALTGALNPVSIVETIKDENLKRRLETVGVGLLWSQYITFLYETGNAIQDKFAIGIFAPVFKKLAASAYVMLNDEDVQKVVLLSVPKELSSDSTLLESIQYAERGEKGTKKS